MTDEAATTPLILAEVDHLASARAGANALRAFRKDLARGAYFVDWWSLAAAQIAEIAEGYVDLGVSLADASLIALADRFKTDVIATFDHRHFRAVKPLNQFTAFSLPPSDK